MLSGEPAGTVFFTRCRLRAQHGAKNLRGAPKFSRTRPELFSSCAPRPIPARPSRIPSLSELRPLQTRSLGPTRRAPSGVNNIKSPHLWRLVWKKASAREKSCRLSPSPNFQKTCHEKVWMSVIGSQAQMRHPLFFLSSAAPPFFMVA